MARVTRGTLVQMDPLANTDLWFNANRADGTEWQYWNSTTGLWATIAATLTRIAKEDMSDAAPVTTRVAGQVLSHNDNTTRTFVVGTGWTGVAGITATNEDDFIWDGAKWIRTTSTPLSDTVGVIN